jgi:hypothetical protein
MKGLWLRRHGRLVLRATLWREPDWDAEDAIYHWLTGHGPAWAA